MRGNVTPLSFLAVHFFFFQICVSFSVDDAFRYWFRKNLPDLLLPFCMPRSCFRLSEHSTAAQEVSLALFSFLSTQTRLTPLLYNVYYIQHQQPLLHIGSSGSSEPNCQSCVAVCCLRFIQTIKLTSTSAPARFQIGVHTQTLARATLKKVPQRKLNTLFCCAF